MLALAVIIRDGLQGTVLWGCVHASLGCQYLDIYELITCHR